MVGFISESSMKPLFAIEGIILPTSRVHKGFLFDAQDEPLLARDDARTRMGSLRCTTSNHECINMSLFTGDWRVDNIFIG